MTIQEFEEKLLQYIDDSIDTATDDELFAGGYLRGHISLAAAECESHSLTSVNEILIKISSSIESAKSELNPSDYRLICNFWNKLHSRTV
ncbi:TPA: YfcL family protein [Photobacterium damselae]